MANIWLTSDSHFSHRNMACVFTLADGAPCRPFKDEYEQDEVLIAKWNAVVTPQDKVYHLGDVCFTVGALDRIMPRLAGHKRLVRGNHDTLQIRKYLQYFDEVYASRVLDRMVLTHIPIHPASLRRFHANLHGHTHSVNYGFPYVNLCVEQTDYAPVDLETVKQRVRKMREACDA